MCHLYNMINTFAHRDDDNDMDEDDDRVDFTLNAAERERQHMKDTFLAAEHGSDEESDQERDWERQQIKKVVGGRAAADQVMCLLRLTRHKYVDAVFAVIIFRTII